MKIIIKIYYLIMKKVRRMNPTGVTLSELLRLPVLKDAKVISGEKGLNRIVRFVDIMEVPDVSGWLREGELLLTTAYSIRHDPTLLPKLVEQLAEAEAAALAIKPERFLHDMPIEMLQMSNNYHLPIIQLPNNIPYMDITNAVMEQIIDKQGSLLRRSEEIYKNLTTLVLENQGIQTVADNVAGLLKSSIWLVDKTGETIVSSPADTSDKLTLNTSFWNITVDKQLEGRLFIKKENLDELEIICVEQARLVFSLELMRRKTAMETEKKIRGDFIDELLSGLPLSKQVIINKGNQLGFKPELEWEVAIVESESETITLFIDKVSILINQESQKVHVKSHVHRQGDKYILLLASQNLGQELNPLEKPLAWREILNPFMNDWKDIRLGLGRKTQLWDINRSFLEAKKAIMIGSRMNKNPRMFTYEEIEILDLLIDASEYVNMDSFVEKRIGKLCEYDRDNGADLVTTLYHYLSTGGSLIETAKQLFIHRNSVKYRIDRIKSISNIDLDNYQERFEYYYCIIYYLLKRD